MKINKRKVIWILVALCLLGVFCIPVYQEKKRENNQTDGLALHSIIAEAYLNINADPDFINTASENQPMEIPEKYYTYVESVQGDGCVHVVVYADGHVDAYFGTPEKTREYYLGHRFR